MASPNRIRRVVFRTNKLVRDTRDRFSRALDIVADEMEQETKQRLGVQGTRQNRSRPGEPPRRQTGNLQGNVSIRREGHRIVLRGPQYGFWLDGGTGTIARRPWVPGQGNKPAQRWLRRIRTVARELSR